MSSLIQIMLRLKNDERGQVLPLVAVILTFLLGMAGMVADVGHMMYSRAQLQAITDAAALAGANALPYTTATSVATTYSAVSGAKNARTNLPNVTMVSGYPALKCLTALKNMGMACSSPSNANAIQVRQTMNVPMYFMGLFGHSTMPVSAPWPSPESSFSPSSTTSASVRAACSRPL